MRRFFLIFCLLVACDPRTLAQSQEWRPIGPQDLRMKEVPGVPGAAAVQLYYANYLDDEQQSEFTYRRIKILNDKGKSYADVEIVVPPDASLSDLKARTIHPDGKIIEFTGKPFQKVVIRQRGLKIMAKAFTLPDVTIGSIVEYKYSIDLPGVYLDNSWTIQHELYTVKEDFSMKPFGGLLEGFEKGHKVAVLSSRTPGNLKPKEKGGGYELEVSNMPPFEPEGFMPPEENYKPQIRFFYGGIEIASTEKFWQEAGRDWNREAEHFIGRHHEIADEAARVIGTETDPAKKLRQLYARTQEIRNLTYEHERTEQETQRENLKSNQNVADVLAHGYADRDGVTLFFVALARAAGFDASVLRVSDRQERFFDRGLLSRRQLGYQIAMVVENGQNIFLDPGTRFAPFGLVRWMHTSSLALKLDKDGGSFIKIPAAGYNQAMIRRSAEVAVDAAGSLSGTITVRFEGGEALERRLDALATDGPGRKSEVEDEVKDWLPAGAEVKLVGVENWEGSEQPLSATFSVELPAYAGTAGKRLLLPSYLFASREMNIFQHAERKYPVYFAYAFGESDTVAIKIPDGYEVESIPPQQSSSLSYATYLDATEFADHRVVTHRVLQVNGIFFQVDIYPEIRDFFSKVRTGDEQRTVLREGTAKAARGPGTVLH